jgi:hypothetical protein
MPFDDVVSKADNIIFRDGLIGWYSKMFLWVLMKLCKSGFINAKLVTYSNLTNVVGS